MFAYIDIRKYFLVHLLLLYQICTTITVVVRTSRLQKLSTQHLSAPRKGTVQGTLPNQ
jgi:hypothetical protein